MTRTTRKRLILIGAGLLVAAALVYGFLPKARPVDAATVERGPLTVIVEEEGETQASDTYVISSPVTAFARRITLQAGDRVQRGDPIVRLEPPRAAILDPRSQVQAQSRVEAARAAVEQAEQNAQAAGAAAAEAEEERKRVERLFESESATRQRLTQARSAAQRAQASLEAAEAAVEASRAELVSAQASLQQTAGPSSLSVAEVLTAPVAGRVLAVHRESEGQVTPGEPLVELGDVDNLEVRVDVLSQDAVRITPGIRVVLEQWGGEVPLEAAVSRVEPQGFTDVSSLGVEEKRVTVIAGMTSPPERWSGLGAGYRVLAQFVVWEADDVLLVPLSALFRTDDGWAVFVLQNGEAIQRSVDIGQQSGLSAEVLSGLQEGEEVIVHPANDLEDGTRVERRDA
jgi:HlyD family secretion protein